MDDLLDRANNLRVKDDEGWEVNEDREAEVGNSCLMGRFCTTKNLNRALIRTILGRVWGLAEVDWGVKIKKVTTEASFLIFSFKNGKDLDRIESKSPWILNNGVLILQRLIKIPLKWEDEMKRFPLSGRILNLPMKSITRNNMLRLATMAGEVIAIQKEEVAKIALNGNFWFKVGDRKPQLEKMEAQSVKQKPTEETLSGQGINIVPTITNKNSQKLQVTSSNPLLSYDFENLTRRINDQSTGINGGEDLGSGSKKREDFEAFLNREAKTSLSLGKRVHWDEGGNQQGLDLNLNFNEMGGEWREVHIPIGTEDESGNSGSKRDKRRKIIPKRTRKGTINATPPSLSNITDMETTKEVTGKRKAPGDISNKWIPRGAPFRLRSQKCTKQEFETFLGISWMVWNHRNKKIFQNNKTPLKTWIPWALDLVAHTLESTTKEQKSKKEKEKHSWQAPPNGIFSLNCDAALKMDHEGYATAAVIRNNKGNLIAAKVCFYPGYTTVLMAECLALKMGIKLVQDTDSKPFIANSDNITAVHQINSKKAPRADWAKN
ncbi:hypothetical protein F8388_014642 [Cannabis sativa]|uniref:RNase H type-1 domain-containing protein n=1 Tax=Cannabis sativa TaxID=3483 RepID=A0A7J6E492_CANSA|nr:hypothetical protein F8388_014642 [Cannabis sativa]